MRSLSRSQTLQPPNVWTSPLVETVELVPLARDANADAHADGAGRSQRSAQPQLAVGTQIDAIIPFVNMHCFRKAAGPARQVHQTPRSAITLHQRDSFQRFKRAQQYSRPYAGLLARNIHHEAGAVREIHVGASAFEKKRPSAWSFSPKRVACRIANRVRLRLDNAPTQSALWQIVDQHLSDQIPRQFQRVHGQFRSAQVADVEWCIRLFSAHHLQLTGFTFSMSEKNPSVSVG